MPDVNRLGTKNYKYASVKSTSGSIWTCDRGKLCASGNQKVKLSATETLALANLLIDSYSDIVEAARSEQRQWEFEHSPTSKPAVRYR